MLINNFNLFFPQNLPGEICLCCPGAPVLHTAKAESELHSELLLSARGTRPAKFGNCNFPSDIPVFALFLPDISIYPGKGSTCYDHEQYRQSCDGTKSGHLERTFAVIRRLGRIVLREVLKRETHFQKILLYTPMLSF